MFNGNYFREQGEIMALEVLLDKSQISKAREEMEARGLSVTESALAHFLRKLRISRKPKIGDKVKSWDVLSAVNFISHNVNSSEPVLDIGCYASEILYALSGAGFNNLSGVDLNPNLEKMPTLGKIKFVNENFLNTTFEDKVFKAITAISVIEHGFKGKELLGEISRLLKPGGFFWASFDYWPQKINTDKIKFFGMDWKIFSQEEIAAFIDEAQSYDLFPYGELKFDAKEKTINCAGQEYTFAALILQKKI